MFFFCVLEKYSKGIKRSMIEYRIKQYRRFLYILLILAICALLTAIYMNYWGKVPSTIKIRAGIEETLNFDVPVSGRIYQSGGMYRDEAVYQGEAIESLSDRVESIPISLSSDVTLRASQIDHYIMDLKLFGVFPYKSVDIQVIRDKTLIPSGIPIGIYVRTNGILVVWIGEFENEQG